ncbi:glycosyltransferase [Microbacterium oryzae]|uniref:glycosyltransferase n=1 Tax=Microbacterium oryzae TaxID=743009 RepID=UPI0025B0D497|nr:glycosyltransferase [Microbacterium oryzae]MDN3310118.1 glycosyltransferase [Microbacterium oryzae]
MHSGVTAEVDHERAVEGRFHRGGPVEVAVLVVTYRNAAHIDALVADLRREAAAVSLRVIIADNSSSDSTLAVARRHDDVIAVATGGNLGYSGGLNVAMSHAGTAEAVLVLNPDLRVSDGAINTMLRRLRLDQRIGAVVPLINDAHGQVYPSLRREPTLVRACADGALGRVWQGRPGALSEYVRSADAYRRAHPIEWATGAAILIRRDAAAAVGSWDERFFLYSEETDFQRRLREAGFQIWFEPDAVVVHEGSGSGTSADLVALTIVNRVRYMDKHAPRRAGAFRAAVVVGEQLRRDPSHARARWALARRARWAELPRAERDPIMPEEFPAASIIIPAHDEAAVIERTLRPLSPLAEDGRVEVIVVCNGCADDTAARARAIPGVRVLETAVPSKTAALNLGDEHATHWPRIYLDADIGVSPEALEPVIRALADGHALAGRPAFRVVTEGASPLVRAYYRARDRMPSTRGALWGAGAYGLSEEGHGRLGRFPDVTADDLHVDRLFHAAEKTLPDGAPVEVTPPRTADALVRVLTRNRRGPAEQGVETAPSSLRELARTVVGPLTAADALVYAGFALAGRVKGNRAARKGQSDWERDESSRSVGSALPASSVDHVILTRFNLPTPGPESLVRAREGWLRERIDLFERYTVPSVSRQTERSFRWIVYLDPQSPSWLLERLAPHVAAGLFTPLYRESVSWQDVAADARSLTGASGSILLTTNLDNDDAIADDFVHRLQTLARANPHAALFLGRGIIAHGDEVYLRRDDENAFCSVAEPWDAPLTAWRDWHTLLRNHLPVVTDRGRPAWLQVVHGGNVSNRVRGVRVSPDSHRTLFGDLLDDVPSPPAGTVAFDRLVRSPARYSRETARGLGKRAFVAVAGKDGLDRLKARIATR